MVDAYSRYGITQTMKFKTITYQLVKNLGNYESERLEMTAELNDEDDVDEAEASLRSKVEESLNIKVDSEINPF